MKPHAYIGYINIYGIYYPYVYMVYNIIIYHLYHLYHTYISYISSMYMAYIIFDIGVNPTHGANPDSTYDQAQEQQDGTGHIETTPRLQTNGLN